MKAKALLLVSVKRRNVESIAWAPLGRYSRGLSGKRPGDLIHLFSVHRGWICTLNVILRPFSRQHGWCVDVYQRDIFRFLIFLLSFLLRPPGLWVWCIVRNVSWPVWGEFCWWLEANILGCFLQISLLGSVLTHVSWHEGVIIFFNYHLIKFLS